MGKSDERESASRRAVIEDPPSVPLDGTVPYCQGWNLVVPETSGVYLIHDLRGPLYIGRTGNLSTRYRRHFRLSHNPLLNAALGRPVGRVQFSWLTCSVAESKTLERYYIYHLRPICNEAVYREDPTTRRSS